MAARRLAVAAVAVLGVPGRVRRREQAAAAEGTKAEARVLGLGSAGVDYLDQTALRYRVFHDVWAVRTILIRERFLPEVSRSEAYALGVGQ